MSQGGDERESDDGGSLDDLAVDAVSAPSGGGAVDEPEPGEPVAAYCDRLKLDATARIRVFQAVCRVVHQAHQKGMIFGDLDPSRVMIAADGAAVVRDSGGAGPIGEWSSPERVLGEPPTTAADVYALGVLLYELLTGRRPYRVDYDDPAALGEAIVDQLPERPSRAAPGDRGRIAADLDWIVARALLKEPEERFASAAELADDLDRFLARLPVRGRRGTEFYRIGLFLKRRKWIYPVAAALVLGAIAGAAWGARRFQAVRRERERAERLERAARLAMAGGLARLVVEPMPGDDPAAPRRDLLASLARYYDDFLKAGAGEPWAMADAQTQAATIARALGDRQAAAAGFRQAVERWKGVVAARPDDLDSAFRLAMARAELGRSLVADDATADGPEVAEALGELDAARALFAALADADPEWRAPRLELAKALADAARLQRRGAADAALGSIRRAVKLWEELVWEAPADLDARLALAEALATRAGIERARPEGAPAALGSLDRAVEVLAAEPNADEPSPRAAFELAKRLDDLAALERTTGAVPSAIAHADRASKLLESLSTRFPAEADHRAELALAYNLLAELRRGRGERASALELAEKARELLERLMVEEPDDPAHPIDLATTWQLIGRLHGQSRHNVEALRAFRRAIDLLEGRKELDGPGNYALACNLSLGLSLVGARDGAGPLDDDDPSLSPADKLRRQVYADRAVAVLGQAVAQGFDNLDLYRTDPALDPLRSRDDFKKLLADLAAPGERGA